MRKLILIILIMQSALYAQITDILGTDAPNAGRIKINNNFDYVDGRIDAVPGWIRDSLNVYRTDGLLDTLVLDDDMWIWYVRIHQYNELNNLEDISHLPYDAFYPKDIVWRDTLDNRWTIVRWTVFVDSLAADTSFIDSVAANMDALYLWDAKDSLAATHFYVNGGEWYPRIAGMSADSIADLLTWGSALSHSGGTINVNAGLGTYVQNDSLKAKPAIGGGVLVTENGIELDPTDGRNYDYSDAENALGDVFFNSSAFLTTTGEGIVLKDTSGTFRIALWIGETTNWINFGNAATQTRINAKDTLYINADYTTGISYNDLDDVPSTFTPSSHVHAATDVTSGTLSTDRYSAYSDLGAESKIGTGSAQVAAGDHGHSGVYQPLDDDLTSIAALNTTGYLRRITANTWVLESATFDNYGGWYPDVEGTPMAIVESAHHLNFDGKWGLNINAQTGEIEFEVDSTDIVDMLDRHNYLTTADLSAYMVKTAFGDSFDFNITDSDQNWKTSGSITGDNLAVLDSAGASLTIINYVEATEDYTILGNSGRRLVLKGGNATDAVDIDNGITNINQLTLDNALGTSYFSAYSDLGAESKIGTGAAQVAAGNHNHSGVYLESEVDGSITNEIEVVNETYNATNFNNDNTSGVSQNNFYDYNHIADTDDDGLPNKIDATTAGFVKSDASGVLSIDTNSYLTSQYWTQSGSNIYYSTGSVGIGGPPAAGLALDVTGDFNMTGDLGVGDDILLQNNNYLYSMDAADANNVLLIGLNSSNYLNIGQGTIIDTIRFVINGEYPMIISSNKNVYVKNTLQAEQLTSTDDATVTDDLYVGGEITGATWNGVDLGVSQLSITLPDPFEWSGNNFVFNYEPTDFYIDGEGVFGIKSLSIQNADIAASTIDTTKINDTQFVKYVQDHSSAASSIGYWDYLYIDAVDLYLTGSTSSLPEIYTTYMGGFITALQFDGTELAGSEENIEGQFVLPEDVVADSGFYFATVGYIGTATSSDVRFRFQYREIDAGEAYAAYPDSTFITMTSSFTANVRYRNHSSRQSLSGAIGGAAIPFNLSRRVNDAGDSYTSNFYLKTIGLKCYRRLENY